jgi:ATP-dependent Zn protease
MVICQYDKMQNMDIPHIHVQNMQNNMQNLFFMQNSDMLIIIIMLVYWLNNKAGKLRRGMGAVRFVTCSYSAYSAHICTVHFVDVTGPLHSWLVIYTPSTLSQSSK